MHREKVALVDSQNLQAVREMWTVLEIRVRRSDGSIADAQLRWTYSFSDGLIHHAEFAPLAAAVAR